MSADYEHEKLRVVLRALGAHTTEYYQAFGVLAAVGLTPKQLMRIAQHYSETSDRIVNE